MLFRVFTVLAVLALAISILIVRSPSSRRHAAADARQADLPGYYLKNAVLTDYDLAGNPAMRIEAERIDQIAHSTEVALYNVKVDYLAPNGQAWVMVGDVAHVEPGGKVVDVTGNVRLQGEDSDHEGTAVVRTDKLSYDVEHAIASTRSDVRVEFGAHTLTARGLIANLKDRTLRLESKVNGHFRP